jgi:hypothetical protein
MNPIVTIVVWVVLATLMNAPHWDSDAERLVSIGIMTIVIVGVSYFTRKSWG